jgi:hypothetical protein
LNRVRARVTAARLGALLIVPTGLLTTANGTVRSLPLQLRSDTVTLIEEILVRLMANLEKAWQESPASRRLICGMLGVDDRQPASTKE